MDTIVVAGLAFFAGFAAGLVYLALVVKDFGETRPLKCILGFHLWVRRGGAYVKGSTAGPVRPRVSVEMLAEASTRFRKVDVPERPPPTGYITDRYEQCFRCNKTRWGWPAPVPYWTSPPVAESLFGPNHVEPDRPWPRPPASAP